MTSRRQVLLVLVHLWFPLETYPPPGGKNPARVTNYNVLLPESGLITVISYSSSLTLQVKLVTTVTAAFWYNARPFRTNRCFAHCFWIFCFTTLAIARSCHFYRKILQTSSKVIWLSYKLDLTRHRVSRELSLHSNWTWRDSPLILKYTILSNFLRFLVAKNCGFMGKLWNRIKRGIKKLTESTSC